MRLGTARSGGDLEESVTDRTQMRAVKGDFPFSFETHQIGMHLICIGVYGISLKISHAQCQKQRRLTIP